MRKPDVQRRKSGALQPRSDALFPSTRRRNLVGLHAVPAPEQGRAVACRSVVNTKCRRADWRMTGRPPSAEPVTRRAAISRARAVRSGRSRPERAARRPAPDCYGAQRGRAAPELRGECSPHSAWSWNLGRELRRSVSTRGSREAVSRSGRIQFGCIPVAAGPFTPVRLVNRLLVRCLLIRASDVTVHPYSPYLVSVITHAMPLNAKFLLL